MEALLTRDEAAARIKKPASWLRWAERQKLIPYVKVGQQIRYRVSDLDEWIASRVVHPVRAQVDALRDRRGLR